MEKAPFLQVGDESDLTKVLNLMIQKVLKEGGHVSIWLDGSRLILKPISKDLKEKVQEWASLALSLRVEAFTEESKESWKWMSREYAKRKLGLS